MGGERRVDLRLLYRDLAVSGVARAAGVLLAAAARAGDDDYRVQVEEQMNEATQQTPEQEPSGIPVKQGAWAQAPRGAGGRGLHCRLARASAWRRWPDVELVAVCDQALGRAQALAGKFGIPHAYGSLEAMLGAEKLDAAHILLPPDLHFAAARGGHRSRRERFPGKADVR